MATEKQIAWATKIRDEKLEQVREVVAQATKNQDKAAHALELLERRSAEKSANFWIDKRNYPADVLMVHVLRREQDIIDAREVVSGKDPLDFDGKRLSEFLHLIDDKVVPATRQQRNKIYEAMCALLDAEARKERTVSALKSEQYNDHGKHGWSNEWYAQMTKTIQAAQNKPVREYINA